MFNSTSKKHSKSSIFSNGKNNNNESDEKSSSSLLIPTPYYYNLNNNIKTEYSEINFETKTNENSDKITTKERKNQNYYNYNFFTTTSSNNNYASNITNNSTRLSWIRSSILNKKYPSMTTNTIGLSSRLNLKKPNKFNQKSQSLDNNNKNINNDYRESRKSIRSLQAKFASSSSAERTDDGGGNSAMRGGLITKLDKYTTEELKEYRQIFNMFDADRSGAIGIEELESAITNLGMDSKQIDVEMLMREADKRGNHQIDFDEFCEVMKTTSEKTQSWNEVIKECFNVFDRNESGLISKKDFDFVLRELGDIQNSRLIDELFIEYDVDGDGFIDFDEFSFLVRNYLTDEDV
ncbi:unnamed protein product [Meloidogyne enterolobii]|uniref:Uncharacterized protein n=1 Tax=Meloidogyne enterolobii TaxID=390850 RepID=A0ACB1B2W2_MELEN